MLLACSKPATDQSSDEFVAADSVALAAVPTTPTTQPISLTPEQIERVNFEVFLTFRYDWLLHGNPEVMAYKEDFNTNGTEFHYTLLRHNGTALLGQGSLTDKSEVEGDINNNEIDTIRIDGNYIVYPESVQESKVMTIRCVFAGSQKHLNSFNVRYGQVSTFEDEYRIAEQFIELSTPRILTYDDLYLKAKVTELTDRDLAGLDKDELSYLRNEIFARHGHTFKTDKMISHFSQMKWYHSLIDDAASLLNNFERKNVEFIKKKEG